MNIKEARVGIIQDRATYIELAEYLLEEAKLLAFAPTMPAAFELLERIAENGIELDLVCFDENLTGDDDSGSDGKALFKQFKDLGLEQKVRAVSISSYPRLPIEKIGSKVDDLLTFIESM